MAVLTLLLRGNTRARSTPELAGGQCPIERKHEIRQSAPWGDARWRETCRGAPGGPPRSMSRAAEPDDVGERPDDAP